MSSQQNTGLEAWNVTAKQVVKVYQVNATGALAWSPDGKELAYAGYNATNGIVLIDAQNEKQIYFFPVNLNVTTVSALAWSPDGKYIASGEDDNIQQISYVRVWVA
ncbi:MAG: WD40 repeat domain-containing protein [Ktedonobacteraceae bacterium]